MRPELCPFGWLYKGWFYRDKHRSCVCQNVMVCFLFTLPSDPQLDLKYFQKSEEPSLRTSATRAVSPTPFYFPTRPPAAAGPTSQPPSAAPSVTARPHHGGRLSKDLVAPRGTAPSVGRPTQQQPPLASAYFPGATKVS